MGRSILSHGWNICQSMTDYYPGILSTLSYDSSSSYLWISLICYIFVPPVFSYPVTVYEVSIPAATTFVAPAASTAVGTSVGGKLLGTGAACIFTVLLRPCGGCICAWYSYNGLMCNNGTLEEYLPATTTFGVPASSTQMHHPWHPSKHQK